MARGRRNRQENKELDRENTTWEIVSLPERDDSGYRVGAGFYDIEIKLGLKRDNFPVGTVFMRGNELYVVSKENGKFTLKFGGNYAKAKEHYNTKQGRNASRENMEGS